jgi:hypothetical protein
MDVYIIQPITDVDMFEGFAFHSNSVSLLGRESAVMDFFPDFRKPERPVQIDTLKSFWRPIKVDGRVRGFNDYPCIDLCVPAFSKRAVEGLGEILKRNGELLPLESEAGEYFAFNCRTVADVLDRDKSRINYRQDGFVAMSVDYFAFLDDLLDGLTMFRIPELCQNIFVTDDFLKRVIELELLGFEFLKVWKLTPDTCYRLQTPISMRKGKCA